MYEFVTVYALIFYMTEYSKLDWGAEQICLRQQVQPEYFRFRENELKAILMAYQNSATSLSTTMATDQLESQIIVYNLFVKNKYI